MGARSVRYPSFYLHRSTALSLPLLCCLTACTADSAPSGQQDSREEACVVTMDGDNGNGIGGPLDGRPDRIETRFFDDNIGITRIEIDDDASGISDQIELYSYNDRGWLVTKELYRAGYDEADRIYSYQYDSEGNRISTEGYSPFDDTTFLTIEAEYGPHGIIRHREDSADPRVAIQYIYEAHYEYSSTGLLQKLEWTREHEGEYGEGYRLYSYNSDRNLSQSFSQYTWNDEPPRRERTDYRYGENGKLSEESRDLDDNGSIEFQTQYNWNEQTLLTSKLTTSRFGDSELYFEYDSRNRVIFEENREEQLDSEDKHVQITYDYSCHGN